MSTHIHIHTHSAARTADAGFNEADHPRDDGKFTSGGKVNHPGSTQPGTYHGPVSAAHSKASGHKEHHSWVTNSLGTKQMHQTASLSKYKPTYPSAGKSLAQIAQGLVNKGAVKPGSTTPAPVTAPKLRATGLQSSKFDAVK